MSKVETADARVVGVPGDTIYQVIPETQKGRDWVEENIDPDESYQPFWPYKVIVEHRYISDIVNGMEGDGLKVNIGTKEESPPVQG